ncbi:hypothetical protein ACOACO_16620 [Nocardioides sp. CPCC 205120]|uniref:hypothetical protein n=1 Tax=Nocardioides sp. CPCC 205120 TaxID=3406462 RepID=UPI003B508F64
MDTDLGTDREIDEGTGQDTGRGTDREAAEPAAGSAGGTTAAAPRGRRERLLAALPWVVVVAALALAVVGGRAWWHAEHDPDLDRAAQRDAALIAARTHVATLTTLDGADVDAGLEAWGEATTGLLHDQVTGVDDTNREMLTDIGSTSVGRVVDAAVLELDGPTATVLVSVEVSVAELDAPGAEPTVKRNRFAADLRLVDDEWLLEDLQQVAVTL